ncbi:hypothetical protein [Sphingomicrobium astaxanthinifaciens]|uniref:hypothetical protein n=1 Tax=Sphingomicrobium astaxanthinifaciens TaxID=1227949 RepID=UPI001FCAF99E|nr:hypothetical protein [Sphingomicrobium astaxanthinifaciens]MCJ7420905.1 hypothetical protein [Sphingomicrobium astaxanthinifaciens]
MPELQWGLVTIIGVAALFVIYLFVIKKNKDSDIPVERSERATRELYEEEHEAAEKREGDA